VSPSLRKILQLIPQPPFMVILTSWRLPFTVC
jgi:hypothetical protein